MESRAMQAAAMDKLYRGQKRIYDATRRYYLLGRDPALARIEVRAGAHICEVGTGTARNLVRLARRAPQGHYHGLDISAEMLEQAARNIARAELATRIDLNCAAAEDLDYRAFGLAAPFDAIVFSYCLSIVPQASVGPALAAAWRNLAPGGTLYCVDFGPLPEWPALARWLFTLVRKLGLFHGPFEGYRQDVVDGLVALAPERSTKTPLCGGYAQLITVRKSTLEVESAFGRALIDQVTDPGRAIDGPFTHREET